MRVRITTSPDDHVDVAPALWVTWFGRSRPMQMRSTMAKLTALLEAGDELELAAHMDKATMVMDDPMRIVSIGGDWAVLSGDADDVSQHVTAGADPGAAAAVQAPSGDRVWSGPGTTWDALDAIAVATRACFASTPAWTDVWAAP